MQSTRINSQNDIAAEIPKESETCRFCKNRINDGASICHHCGRHQVIIMQYLRAEWVGILISVVMMVIAFRELHIARVERQEVEKALRDANAALKTALSVERKAGELEVDASLQPIRAKKMVVEAELASIQARLYDLENSVGKPSRLGGPKNSDEKHVVFRTMDKLHVKIRDLRREIKRLDEQLAKSDNQQNDHSN